MNDGNTDGQKQHHRYTSNDSPLLLTPEERQRLAREAVGRLCVEFMRLEAEKESKIVGGNGCQAWFIWKGSR
jgi:hypothetical protein